MMKVLNKRLSDFFIQTSGITSVERSMINLTTLKVNKIEVQK